DLDYTKKQDDERFQGLLKTDWTNAANEVAQAMARVNAEWLSTGQKVAELQAKAESGDIESQRELEKALELRKELAQERNSLEGRQRDFAETRQEGERSYANIRDIAAGEAKHKAREDFEQAASINPRAANAALEEFIASLEDQLTRSVSRGRQAQLAQDYAGASAYEAQAKAVQGQLSELRGMQGQRREREGVTGDFNARAMEAMMRGGGGKAIEQRQLETQQKMADRLGKLVDLYQAPTVVAME
ncbi:MAG: hypothetical protein FWG74_08470, partial [Planctomycetes bacterium]|nr:hypothetical protein [Planctomycetota bacterium]